MIAVELCFCVNGQSHKAKPKTETVTNIFKLISSVCHVEMKNLVQKAQTHIGAIYQKVITMETITTDTGVFN